MIHASYSALGRNWHTADTAKLITGPDWARWELHWNDGACVQCCENNKEDAIAELSRLGFLARQASTERIQGSTHIST